MVAKKIQHRKGLATDNQPFLISMVAKSMHLTKSEAALFSILCAQQDGFSPSAKFLMNKTSLSHGGVYKARTALNKMGMIGETDYHIVIDWNRIRLLSTLNPRTTRRSAYVAPVVHAKTSNKEMSGDWKKKVPKEYKPDIDFLVYAPEETVFEFFQCLSEAEYQDVRENIELALAH